MIKSYAKLKKQNKEKFKIPKSAQDTVPIDTINFTIINRNLYHHRRIKRIQ